MGRALQTLTALGMLIFFCSNVLEALPFRALQKSNSKTCCGRVICQCSHPKDARCPLRQKSHSEKIQPEKVSKKSCHLNVPKKIESKTTAAASSKFPVFKESPCSKSSPEGVPAWTAKEFFPVYFRKSVPVPSGKEVYDGFLLLNSSLFLPCLERPPRLF